VTRGLEGSSASDQKVHRSCAISAGGVDGKKASCATLLVLYANIPVT